MSGFGDFVSNTGKAYSGFYNKDLKEGLGLYYSNNPIEVYFGYWKQGKRDGPAIQISEKGKYYSFWENGKQIAYSLNIKEISELLKGKINLPKKYSIFFTLKLEEKLTIFSKRKELLK